MKLTKEQAKARILEMMDTSWSGKTSFVPHNSKSLDEDGVARGGIRKGCVHVGKVEIFQLLDEIYDEDPVPPGDTLMKLLVNLALIIIILTIVEIYDIRPVHEIVAGW